MGAAKKKVEQAKHTPGPWLVGGDNAIGIEITDANGAAVGFRAYGSDAEALANARLIAGAPELLATLRDLNATARAVLAGERPVIQLGAFIAKADAAITKAEGRS